jgi:hypothetical protein
MEYKSVSGCEKIRQIGVHVRDFLLPETIVREDGTGPRVGLGASKGTLLEVILGITRIIEQESLNVAVWGSTDGANWGSKPIAQFPQKFYCATYPMRIDLAEYPEIEFLQARWKVNRWGRGDAPPLFGFYLFAETVPANAMTATAA